MYRKIFCIALFSAGLTAVSISLRAQHKTNKYSEVNVSDIQPKGWLLSQLSIMRDGTSGHLDEVYEKVKNDNGWLGGSGDGWEETPYWLDGAVPLAFLLKDTLLQNKVMRYLNWTMNNQRPSGYFGPTTKWEKETGKKIGVNDCEQGEDWWPKMVMLKTLQQYYLATGDKRVIDFMTKYFNYQLATLNKCRIGKWTEWSQSRGADNVLMVQWLYNITHDSGLLRLASLIQDQSFPWSTWFLERDWVINAAVHQNHDKWMTRHGVNVAMGIKDPVVHYQRTGDAKYLKALHTGFDDLMTLHGLPFGIFSADEDLHGNAPEQGVELCAIVEAMFSLEHAVAVTGDCKYMDALERMTFNALPSQTTDDYNNKQYFQIANQVNIAKGVFNFSLPFEREMNNVLGMRSGYTCCLANMHQGWTKFATHLWYGTEGNGIAALHFSPNTYSGRLGRNKVPVTIDEVTNYPFEETIDFNFTMRDAAAFPFHLRIPAWCSEAEILLNGKLLQKEKGGRVVVIDRTWRNGDKLSLQLPAAVFTSNWGRNSRTIERGPLVYALKLREIWEKGVDEKEGEYYSVFTKDDWNYGLTDSVVKDPAATVKLRRLKSVDDKFIWNLEHAPIELTAPARKIPDWVMAQGVAPQPVTARGGHYMGKAGDKKEEIVLVPIGCTKVRIVAFPVVK